MHPACRNFTKNFQGLCVCPVLIWSGWEKVGWEKTESSSRAAWCWDDGIHGILRLLYCHYCCVLQWQRRICQYLFWVPFPWWCNIIYWLWYSAIIRDAYVLGRRSLDGGIKQWCCLTFVVYIGPKSRTERPRKTICTKVAHITRNSDTTFKVSLVKGRVTGVGHIVAAFHLQLAKCGLTFVLATN